MGMKPGRIGLIVIGLGLAGAPVIVLTPGPVTAELRQLPPRNEEPVAQPTDHRGKSSQADRPQRSNRDRRAQRTLRENIVNQQEERRVRPVRGHAVDGPAVRTHREKIREDRRDRPERGYAAERPGTSVPRARTSRRVRDQERVSAEPRSYRPSDSQRANSYRVHRHHRFKDLPPEKQEELRKRWREWKKLPPEKREALRKAHRRFQSLSPEEQEKWRERYEKWKKLSPEERRRLHRDSEQRRRDRDVTPSR